jgi:hypothetical protein
VRWVLLALAFCISALATIPAFARGPAAAALAPDTPIQISAEPEAPARVDAADAAAAVAVAAVAHAVDPSGEAPPPSRPRRRGVVLESTLGVLGFGGGFRHLAPPAYWMHAELGYEVLSWLMVFGEGELAFTNTSEAVDPSHARSFPLWGFGGGVRAGVRAGNLGAFVEGYAGALTAEVPHDALAYLGFKNAETLSPQYGARLGVEWYQKDRHLAIALQGGARVAEGFKSGSSDLPLMWDTGLGLRYTF